MQNGDDSYFEEPTILFKKDINQMFIKGEIIDVIRNSPINEILN